MMNRINQLFQQKDKKLLSVYFTAGFPAVNSTGDIIRSLAAHGADMIEVGIPFSDPMADGVIIQQSSAQALQNGMTLTCLLQQLREVRKDCQVPLVLMGYLNPMMQYGIEKLFKACHEIGIDGMIIPDLPFHEYMKSYKSLCEKYEVPVIMLVTPETSEERVKLIDEHSFGFIYMVSSAATTGIKNGFSAEQIDYFRSIDRMGLENKRLIGFGISNPDTFSIACQYSNGAIVGSLFVQNLITEVTVEKAVDKLMEQLYE